MAYAKSGWTALGDPTRRSIFELLVERPCAVGDLARVLPISRPAVSKHLGVLDEAGLVERSAEGREVRFVARPGHLDEVVAWVGRVGSEWDERLDRLRDELH